LTGLSAVELIRQNKFYKPNNPVTLEHSKSSIRRKFSHKLQLRFDDQRLTSFAGLLILHQRYYDLDLRKRIARCFAHISSSAFYCCLLSGYYLDVDASEMFAISRTTQ